MSLATCFDVEDIVVVNLSDVDYMEHMRNDLTSGFYTLPEAANLLALDVVGVSVPALRRLFVPTTRYEEAVRSDRAHNGKVRDISFLDLMELRWLAHFRNQGVSAQALRKMAAAAREMLGEHPFARRDVFYKTDLNKVYAEIAEREGDRRLIELLSRQYELDVIQESLKRGVEFNTNMYLDEWRPRPDEYPKIVINPRMSSGQPSLRHSGVSVDTIVDAWRAEEGDAEAVADWFEIPTSDVIEAVKFRKELPH